MIEALDYTIEQLLRNELNIRNDEIEISFSQPNGEWAGRRSGLALNLFLYDVRENPALRRHQWQQQPEPRNGAGRPGSVQLKRTPLMLDCFYMVSAWSSAEERFRPLEEHQLLSRALRALVRYPVLNPPFEARARAEALAEVKYTDKTAREPIHVERMTDGRMVTEADVTRRAWLNEPDLNRLRDCAVEVRTRIAHHDILTNPAEVWSALEAQMKAGFSYVVTLPLDPWETLEAQQTLEGILRFGQTRKLPGVDGLPRIDPASADPGLYTIGGVIRDQSRRPQAGLRLQLVQREIEALPDLTEIDSDRERFSTLTNAAGEYRFSGLHCGLYTLRIQPASGRTIQRELTISTAGPTGYDFTI